MRTLQILFFSFFVFFVIHGLLWIGRSFVHALEYEQRKVPTTRPFELRWSGPIERILNAAVFFSCLGLVLTGLSLRAYLLVFYFFHTHFRPENFPIDLSALTGMIREEHLRTYRPDYVERLFREGKLNAIRRPARSRQRPWLVFLAGSASLFMGLCLLLLALLATYR